MAQTVQRGAKGAASGSKRKAPTTSSNPPSPAAKKSKTATARKSTGGQSRRGHTGSDDVSGIRGGDRGMLISPFMDNDPHMVGLQESDLCRKSLDAFALGLWLCVKFANTRRAPTS